MKQYYIYKNGEQSGPYPEVELLEKLENRELSFNDMCWAEGMDEWQPLHETIEMPEMAAPPPPPPTPPPPPASSGIKEPRNLSTEIDRNKKPINWIPALVLMCVVVGLSLMVDLTSMGEDSLAADAAVELFLISIPFIIAFIVLFSLLHHRCWVAVPEEYRATTPNKAIGFLFIPVFNFYWAFITWPKLVEGLQKAGYRLEKEVQILAFAYATIFVAGFILTFVPILGSILTVADLIVFIFLYKSIVGSINRERV